MYALVSLSDTCFFPEFCKSAQAPLCGGTSARGSMGFGIASYYRLHFTPTSASWLNLVERFFAELTTKRVRRGVFRSTRQLERAIMEYLDHHNTHPKPFSWTSTADDILKKIKRFCERTSDSGH